MKVLFVSINKLKSYRPALPIGMTIVATQTARHGHDVRCVDLMFEDEDEQVIRREVTAFQPAVVGISIRNVDSLNMLEPAVYTSLAYEVACWARDCCPQTRIVLGGAGFTTIPEDLIEFACADFGITGFAETSFVRLLECIERGEDPRKVRGIIFRKPDGSFFQSAPSRNLDFSRIQAPDRSLYDNRYFEYSFESQHGVETVPETVQTKKGCVLECIFCSNFLIDGTGVKLKDASTVADEFEQIIANGSPTIEIVDGVFNLPLYHALAILKELERRGIRHPWSAMINPGAVNEQLVELMVKTGCREVQLGTDSANDHVLAILKKNFRQRRIREVHRLFEQSGIHIMHCCFIGSPGDDRRSIIESFDVMDELVPDGHRTSRVYWTLGLRICRGTDLFRLAVEEGVIGANERFIVPKYYCSPSVTNDDGLLDSIEGRVVANKNWYLWWGLPNISLRERIDMARQELRHIEALLLNRLAQAKSLALPVLGAH